MNHSQIEAFLWGAQDLLRDNFEPHEFGNYILPFVVLKRLDDVLVDSKDKVLDKLKDLQNNGIKEVDKDLKKVSGGKYFYNISSFNSLKKIAKDPDTCKINLKKYIEGFSENIKEIFKNFEMNEKINQLSDPDRGDLLSPMLEHFTDKRADLSPEKIDHMMMGIIYENLIRKTNDLTKKAAGQYFTPRDVIDLMVRMLFSPHKEILKEPSLVRSIYDPAVGTGGMLYVASNYIKDELKSQIVLNSYGQDNLSFSYAICKSEMIMRGLNPDNIKFGNSLTSRDHFKNYKFRYMLSNPPYGKNWKGFAREIKSEANMGKKGRYHAGLPGQSDGQLLFVQHMISKMYDDEIGSRIAIIFNGSPLFTGSAESGESDIRKWIIKNDLLEAIIALPERLFYNTGINTYIWIISNRKSNTRKGKIQLIDGRSFFEKMKSKLGEKSNHISKKQINKLTETFENFKNGKNSKIFENDYFGYKKVIIKKPLKLKFKIEQAQLQQLKEIFNQKHKDKKQKFDNELQQELMNSIRKLKGNSYDDYKEFFNVLFTPMMNKGIKINDHIKKIIIDIFATRDNTSKPYFQKNEDEYPVSDPNFKFYEKIPLKSNTSDYFKNELKPFLDDDVWLSPEIQIGYEIPFTKIFYKYEKLPSIKEIDFAIRKLQKEISTELEELMQNE